MSMGSQQMSSRHCHYEMDFAQIDDRMTAAKRPTSEANILMKNGKEEKISKAVKKKRENRVGYLATI
ncbi:hypothetical protein TIFTF001_041035 [Ficus carica]|uniref:Uncharacterized protein n=1 Tax=Ficus carica TaxID=3494 RepID=A0AA87Z878_FICCA|nr:hypothetical protein TIFTF001_041035 [Ficus carica]